MVASCVHLCIIKLFKSILLWSIQYKVNTGSYVVCVLARGKPIVVIRELGRSRFEFKLANRDAQKQQVFSLSSQMKS